MQAGDIHEEESEDDILSQQTGQFCLRNTIRGSHNELCKLVSKKVISAWEILCPGLDVRSLAAHLPKETAVKFRSIIIIVMKIFWNWYELRIVGEPVSQERTRRWRCSEEETAIYYECHAKGNVLLRIHLYFVFYTANLPNNQSITWFSSFSFMICV